MPVTAMGQTGVPGVGERFGPCSPFCRHEACDRARRTAASACSVCGEVIGYGHPFSTHDSGEEFAPNLYTHERCEQSKRLDTQHPQEQTMSEQNGAKAQEKDRSHLAVVAPMPLAGGLVPRTLDEAMGVAKLLAASALIPAHLRGKPEDVLMTMIKGLDLGLKISVAFSEIYLVEGKPGCSAMLLRALCLASPLCETFELVESTPTKATYEAKRRGASKPARLSYTIEQAQTAGLAGKDNWKRHPAAMLSARASAALARVVFPDVVQGMQCLDELQEIEGHVIDVKVNRPNIESSAAPIAPVLQRVAPTPPPAPPKPPSSVPDEPVDDDFDRLSKVEPEPAKEEPKPEGMTEFEKLDVLLNEATEPKHLEALHAAIKGHPEPEEQKKLKQKYIRRSTEMVNARKAAAK